MSLSPFFFIHISHWCKSTIETASHVNNASLLLPCIMKDKILMFVHIVFMYRLSGVYNWRYIAMLISLRAPRELWESACTYCMKTKWKFEASTIWYVCCCRYLSLSLSLPFSSSNCSTRIALLLSLSLKNVHSVICLWKVPWFDYNNGQIFKTLFVRDVKRIVFPC